ncbi:unnamed protein product [Cuscuta epithymum]|uniref:Uncharacterized protein n=1 Tax=Cuscuta epithymum TaxID=186058 RepID=A0AAV0ESX9_9ASTE|nr:unnamed protein product [Cuscuta epithymum]
MLLFHLEYLCTAVANCYVFCFSSDNRYNVLLEFCFLLNRDTNLPPNIWHVPAVLFLSILYPSKSKSK